MADPDTDTKTKPDPDSDVGSYLFSRNLAEQPPDLSKDKAGEGKAGEAKAGFDPSAIIARASERAKKYDVEAGALVTKQAELGEQEKLAIDRLAAQRASTFREIGAPKDPKLQKMPQEPPTEKFQDAFKAFGSPGVFLALLGSLATRAPMKAAFQAGAAALEGFQKGDMAAASAQRQRWEDAVKVASENNRTELEQYNAAWKKTEHSMTERAAKLNEIALAKQDVVMKAAIDSGNFDRVAGLMEHREQAQDHVDEVTIREQDRRETLNMQKARLNQMIGGGDPVAAKAIAEGKAAPITGAQAKTNYGRETMEMVYQQNPNYNAAVDWYAKKGAASVTAAAEPRALAATLKTQEQSYSAIQQFEETAKKNGQVLIQLAKNVDVTGMPVIERWIRDGEAALGDPNVKVFHAQLNAYRNEVARIITNPNLTGALTVSAMEEAERFVNGNDSARTIEAVVKLFEGDFGRRKESLIDQMNETRSQLGLTPRPGGTPAAPGGAPGGAPGATGAQNPPPAGGTVTQYDAQGNRVQ